MLYNAKNFTLKIDGVDMDCAAFGRGGKALILIPGLSTRGVKGSMLRLTMVCKLWMRAA